MLILNRLETDFFLAGCHFENEQGDVSDLMKVLHNAPWVSNSEWSAIQTLWDGWEGEHIAGTLYGTQSDGTTTFKLDVTKIPKRPNR